MSIVDLLPDEKKKNFMNYRQPMNWLDKFKKCIKILIENEKAKKQEIFEMETKKGGKKRKDKATVLQSEPNDQ